MTFLENFHFSDRIKILNNILGAARRRVKTALNFDTTRQVRICSIRSIPNVILRCRLFRLMFPHQQVRVSKAEIRPFYFVPYLT